MSELFAIVGNLAWGVVTIAALVRGVARIRAAEMPGFRGAGSILLLILVLLVVNGVALFFVMICGYGEGRATEGLLIRDLLLLAVLLLPSTVVWLALGDPVDGKCGRRWE